MSSGQSPRAVRLSARGRALVKVALFFIVPSVLAALWLTIDIPRELLRREALRRNGIEAIARIEKFGKFGRSSEWWVGYVFVAGGESIRNEVTAPESFATRLSHADTLRVRYLPSDLENNHPSEWEWTILSELGWLVPLAWGFPGLLFANELFRNRRLAVEGAIAIGTVRTCSPVKGGFKIAYEFPTANGNTVEGKGWSWSMKEAGAATEVLYLRRNPKRNQPYPLEHYGRIQSSDSLKASYSPRSPA